MAKARKVIDSSTYANRLALRLRELMDQKGLTPEMLRDRMKGEGLSVAKPTIEAWLSGRNRVDLNAIPILATVLGVKPRTVFPDR